MDMDAVLDAIGGTQAARDYMQGIVEGSEAARDADRSLRAAVWYMRGAGVRDVMAATAPELYAQCALMIAADWAEQSGSSREGSATPLGVGPRQILLQLRYDKTTREVDG